MLVTNLPSIICKPNSTFLCDLRFQVCKYSFSSAAGFLLDSTTRGTEGDWKTSTLWRDKLILFACSCGCHLSNGLSPWQQQQFTPFTSIFQHSQNQPHHTPVVGPAWNTVSSPSIYSHFHHCRVWMGPEQEEALQQVQAAGQAAPYLDTHSCKS